MTHRHSSAVPEAVSAAVRATGPATASRRPVRHLLAGSTLVLATLLTSGIAAAQGSVAVPEWQPVSSERLIRLPGNYLVKAVDQSLATSPLGSELDRVNAGLREQGALLGELQSAVAGAEEPSVELRHQFLEAKSAYLDMMQGQQAMRRAAVERRIALYREAAERLRVDARAARDPIARDLVSRQAEARRRMEASTRRVDETLALIGSSGNGAYLEEYDRNLAQIERLRAELASHPMESGPELGGEEVSREAYLRHLITEAESERSLLDQEEQILGYMARLVSLDARALETEVTLGISGLDGTAVATAPRAADATDFFISR